MTRRLLALCVLSSIIIMSVVESARKNKIIPADEYDRLQQQIMNPDSGNDGGLSLIGLDGIDRPGGRNRLIKVGLPPGNLAIKPADRGRNSNRILRPIVNPDNLRKQYPWLENPGRGRASDRWSVEGPRGLRNKLGLDDRNELSLVRGKKVNGSYKVKIKQKWNGIPLYASNLVAEQDENGEIFTDSLNGEYTDGIEEDLENITPTLGEERAILLARFTMEHLDRPIEEPRIELFIYDNNGTAVLAYRISWFAPAHGVSDQGAGDLEFEAAFGKNQDTSKPDWLINRLSGTSQGLSRKKRAAGRSRNKSRGRAKAKARKLRKCRRRKGKKCNQKNESTTPPPTQVPYGETARLPEKPVVILNAHTGEVLKSFNGLNELSRTRTFIKTGNEKIGTTRTATLVYKGDDGTQCYHEFRIHSTLRVKIVDAHQTNSAAVPCAELESETYDYTNGAISPRNDAHRWAVDAIISLQQLSIQRLELMYDQTELLIEVHHKGFQAVYTGSRILLGDGYSHNDTVLLYPQTTVDVVGHEVAHAATASWSGLEGTGESGALNEGFSDIIAAYLQDKWSTTANPYLLGATITVHQSSIRNLCDPTNPTTLSYNPDDLAPLTYDELQNKTKVEAHRDSSIISLLYCKLSKDRKWGIDLTTQVFVHCNVIYFTPTTTYPEAACHLVQCTRDITLNNVTIVNEIKVELYFLGFNCLWS